MIKRWEEIKRLEDAGEAPTIEDEDDAASVVEDGDDDGDDENADADRTMVEETPLKTSHKSSAPKRPSPTHMPASFCVRASTPAPAMHAITLAPKEIEEYYIKRFSALQQATCKLVVKAWIKVVEPKKQVKFPYNKGEELKPGWWPEGVRHREPDHLSKQERMALLSCILRASIVPVSRLELSTAEAGAFISRPRQSILREVYLVGKEEERRRKDDDLLSDLVVHLPNAPISPSQVSPDGPEKRSRAAMEGLGKENSYAAHASKRMRQQPQPPRLAPLTTTTAANYDPYPTPAYNYVQNPAPWRPESSLGAPPPHLSPYPHDWYPQGSDYARSPAPDAADRYHSHATHLAPILTPGISQGSTPEPPVYPLPTPLSAADSQPPSATYYDRSYLQHQQQHMDYLHHSVHPAYDYASPYLTDSAWENPFNSQSTQQPS